MNAKLDYLFKEIPFWVLLTLLLVALSLVTVIPRVISPYPAGENELAFLSVANGDVKVSDGVFDTAAKAGAILTAKDGRTLLKTGEGGTASLKMPDGSSVMLDSGSVIEFNRPGMTSAGKAFLFNLLQGRALIINGQDSRKPTQVLVGGYYTAWIFQSVIGLEAKENEPNRIKVDCLVGPCFVNSGLELNSGQSALVEQSGTVQLALGIPYEFWIALGKIGSPDTSLSGLFASLRPTGTAAYIPFLIPNTAPTAFAPTASASPSSTLTVLPTITLTPTRTRTSTLAPWAYPSATFTEGPRDPKPPTATLVPTALPTRTSTYTPRPTSSSTPRPTATPLPTATPVTPTDPPLPTATPVPPTRTPRPSHTPKTPDPPTATDTPVPPPTDTPVPPPTDTPVPPPTATDAPPPTIEPTPIIIDPPPGD